MSDCKHCDAGLQPLTLMLGDVPVPGMHKAPTAGGLARVVACKNYRVQVSQKALDDAARSPFWSMLKKDEGFR